MKIINISNTPYNPNIVAPIMKIIRYILSAFVNSGSENINEEIAVMATTIIMIGDTIPADTAASPKIKAPTMEMAELAKLGSLKSLSLNISNDRIINIASVNVENGTFFLCAAILISNSMGIISWLYVVNAIYRAGVNRVIKKVIYLIILVIDTLILLL